VKRDESKVAPGWLPPVMVKGRWRSHRDATVCDHRLQSDCIRMTWKIHDKEYQAPPLPSEVLDALEFVDDFGKATMHGPLPQATVMLLLEAAATLAGHVRRGQP
jgi:hypothetical protein